MDFILVLLAIFLAIVCLGLGASISINDFKAAYKQPKAFFVGFASQFGFMPLFAFAFAKIFDMDSAVAVGVILTGCTPGGSTSNLFTYWSKGNVALSVSMSAASNILALGMMPLLLLMYTSGLDESVSVPFTNIVGSLLILVIPTIGGMVVRSKKPHIAKYMEKGASIIGVIFLIVLLVIGIIDYIQWDAPASIWILAILFEPVGCMFGYGVSNLLGLAKRDARTIAWETGIQNYTLTLAAVLLSFDEGPVRDSVLLFPFMAAFWYIPNSTWLAYIFWKLGKNDPDADNAEAKTAATQPVALVAKPQSQQDKDIEAAPESDEPKSAQEPTEDETNTPADETQVNVEVVVGEA